MQKFSWIKSQTWYHNYNKWEHCFDARCNEQGHPQAAVDLFAVGTVRG